MKTLFLITTALTVSIDSLICGFSLSLNTKRKLPVAIGISLTVFLLCLCAHYLGFYLKNVLTEKTANLGGIILIAVGVFNLLSTKKHEPTKGSLIKQIIVVGFAVGLDGAVANLSLCIMGYDAFYIPLLIAFTHFITISVGIFLSSQKVIGAIGKFDCAAPIILIALGLYKVLCFFI